MSSKEKLLKKAMQNPRDFKFHELESLLKKFGFTQVKTNAGSHFKWRHSQKKITFSFPRKNPVKPFYVKQLIHIIQSELSL